MLPGRDREGVGYLTEGEFTMSKDQNGVSRRTFRLRAVSPQRNQRIGFGQLAFGRVRKPSSVTGKLPLPGSARPNSLGAVNGFSDGSRISTGMGFDLTDEGRRAKDGPEIGAWRAREERKDSDFAAVRGFNPRRFRDCFF